ncbi:MAG TPA: IS1595 family transposase [Acidimicrobiales bacterium]|nr:IS1595 family transposase [Acidimicrobiales bacterium]
MELSIPNIARMIPTEADAYELLEQWRWHGEPVCPHCGSINDHYFLTPREGVRKTNRGTETQRRLWKCKDCRAKFSVLTGTIMHGTHISVRTWVFVIFELCSSKNGIAAREIERRYKLTPKSAWFMLHRIREAMTHGPGADLFSGVVVADETWIGGKPKNRHANKRVGSKQGRTDKTPVVSLIHAETGEVRSKVVANVSARSLRSVIASHARMEETTLHTDSADSYGSCADDLAVTASPPTRPSTTSPSSSDPSTALTTI